MIPQFRRITGDLPPGVHVATWAEFVLRYGYNKRRRHLLNGLERVLQDLRVAGCRRIYIDGSFINDVLCLVISTAVGNAQALLRICYRRHCLIWIIPVPRKRTVTAARSSRPIFRRI